METNRSRSPALAIIVAMDNNRGIGKNNQLLWHIPEDLQYFKRITMGKPLIMGRKTFESIGKPLPGRFSIVITRQQDWQFEGVEVAHSLEQALSMAQIYVKHHQQTDDTINPINEIMVIGGEQIYALSLLDANRIYLTQVDTCLSADAFFPAIDADHWRLMSESSPMVSAKAGYSFLYKMYARI